MGFSGTVGSDYMKLAKLPVSKKRQFIDFTSTDFSNLRDSMLNYVKSVYPTDYQNFNEADLGIMLVELMAYMGAVMSHKADALAHENFLATAKRRESVQRLLKLIGVNMKGPVSSAADARLELETALGSVDDGTPRTLDIQPEERVFSVVSPEDGEALEFTLYRVKAAEGRIFTASSNGALQLPRSESNGGAGQVWDNLVLLEGSLASEEGSFTDAEVIKTVTLNNGPVIEGSVEVVIESSDAASTGAYEQVESIYFASGGTDKIFQVDYDENFLATVTFGDGIVGVNPNQGSGYFISYRVGGGTRGNITSGGLNKKAVLKDNSNNAFEATVSNRAAATGGQEAETIEHAKQFGPLAFRRQDRLVTLNDYNSYTNSFVGSNGAIGKANAVTRKAFCSANIIDVYVLARATDTQFKKVTTPLKLEMLAEINKRKMMTDEVVLVDGLIRTLDLVIDVDVAEADRVRMPQIHAKIRSEVEDFFSVRNSDFGEPFRKANLLREITKVPEVLLARIDNVDDYITTSPNEIVQMNNLVINIGK